MDPIRSSLAGWVIDSVSSSSSPSAEGPESLGPVVKAPVSKTSGRRASVGVVEVAVGDWAWFGSVVTDLLLPVPPGAPASHRWSASRVGTPVGSLRCRPGP